MAPVANGSCRRPGRWAACCPACLSTSLPLRPHVQDRPPSAVVAGRVPRLGDGIIIIPSHSLAAMQAGMGSCPVASVLQVGRISACLVVGWAGGRASALAVANNQQPASTHTGTSNNTNHAPPPGVLGHAPAVGNKEVHDGLTWRRLGFLTRPAGLWCSSGAGASPRDHPSFLAESISCIIAVTTACSHSATSRATTTSNITSAWAPARCGRLGTPGSGRRRGGHCLKVSTVEIACSPPARARPQLLRQAAAGLRAGSNTASCPAAATQLGACSGETWTSSSRAEPQTCGRRRPCWTAKCPRGTMTTTVAAPTAAAGRRRSCCQQETGLRPLQVQAQHQHQHQHLHQQQHQRQQQQRMQLIIRRRSMWTGPRRTRCCCTSSRQGTARRQVPPAAGRRLQWRTHAPRAAVTWRSCPRPAPTSRW